MIVAMNDQNSWKASLSAFFSERALLGACGSFEDQCYVSGRDPRLWSQQDIYSDLIGNILSSIEAAPKSRVLEVGCASGFLAHGVAPLVGRYVGVDIAASALQAAKNLGLGNATFQQCDGGSLPFKNGEFDSAFCYDVFTNFPSFADGAGIIEEMIRVVKPGGKVLIGSIPDEAVRVEYEARSAEVAIDLESRFGSLKSSPIAACAPEKTKWWARLFARKVSDVKPQIVCYYFSRADFELLGGSLGVQCRIEDIHRLNPYRGLRFNAVYFSQME